MQLLESEAAMGIGAGKRAAGVLLASVVIAGVLAGGTALGAIPDGYQRVKVKAAGIKLAVPDSYEVTSMTRKKAEDLLASRPDLVQAGVTVEAVLARPLTAQADLDGDGLFDRTVIINVLPEAPLPSPSDAKQSATAYGGRNVSVEPTTVAGLPALITTYELDVTNVNGAALTITATDVLIAMSSRFVTVVFNAEPDDAEFAATVPTIIKSVRKL